LNILIESARALQNGWLLVTLLVCAQGPTVPHTNTSKAEE
jgi:hypothetical protein